jgi:hypothetical protein
VVLLASSGRSSNLKLDSGFILELNWKASLIWCLPFLFIILFIGMAFAYNKVSGSNTPQIVGDLIAGADPQRNTKIDFDDDQINLVISGSTVLSTTKGAVSITGSFQITGGIFINPSSSGTGQAILVSGSNTVGGSTYIDFLRATNTSVGAITPSKTFRLNNSGSVEIVNNAYSSIIYTLTDAGDISNLGNLSVGGQTTLGTTSEKLTISSGGTGSVTYNTLANSVFYNSGPTGNITANFTNVPTTTAQATSVTVVVSQSATARIIEAIQINSTSSTINWANKIKPTGNANQYDIFGFSLIRSGSTWITLGQMSTYG